MLGCDNSTNLCVKTPIPSPDPLIVRHQETTVAPPRRPVSAALRALEQPAGGFAMVALDQRESLRTMLAAGGDPHGIADDALVAFKRIGIEELSPYASAMLLERLYAVGAVPPDDLAPDCALILAADRLVQPIGEDVASIELDTEVTPELARAVGAKALKMLILWSSDTSVDERAALTGSFIELCRAAGLSSVVEGIVRPPAGEDWAAPDERHEAVLAAAIELSSMGADLYKGQVPGYVAGDLSEVTAWSELVTAALECPWVVLSNGVRADDFLGAVEAACAGGASGFLAGRAIWADTVDEADPRAAIRARSVPRMERLSRIVAASQGATA